MKVIIVVVFSLSVTVLNTIIHVAKADMQQQLNGIYHDGYFILCLYNMYMYIVIIYVIREMIFFQPILEQN